MRRRLEDPIFFTPPPTKIDRRCWKDSSDPPAPDPRMYDIMQQQTNLSADALNWVKDAYQQNLTRQSALDKSTMSVNESLLSDAATARERGAENYKFYMDKYRPVEEQNIKDAQNIDSATNIERVRGQALSDVQQQTSLAQQSGMRSMGRYGIMPNANRMAALNSQLAAQTAAAGAGAMMGAEQGQRDRGVAMRSNVANVGRGYPAQSMAWTQSAQGAGQQSLGNQQGANNQNFQNQNFMQSGYGQAGNQLNQAASQWNSLYGTQMQGYGAQSQANASGSAGLGSLIGMGMKMWGGMADGGPVKGAGTGVSDSIRAINTDTGAPVRISNGEYIVPADVVKVKGTEFFDRLVEKIHTPAAIQRKQAIKR